MQMARVSRIGRIAALLAVVVALVVPASEASAGDGPVATKSGALINYVTGGKLKIGKRVTIGVVCSADCNATATLQLKGPGVKVKGTVSGSLAANSPGSIYFKPNGPALKAMKAEPGKFRLLNSVTATDPATGALDFISRTFRFKR